MSKIAIILVTHGNLGKELINTLEQIMGKQDDVSSVGLLSNDSIFEFKSRIEDEIFKYSNAYEFLVLVDLFGGSPCNSVLKLIKDLNLECVTGVNLPMLLEILINRNGEITSNQLAKISYDAGLQGVRNIGFEFKNKSFSV